VRYKNLEKAQAEREVKDAKKAKVQARKAAKEAGKVASAILEAKRAIVGKNI
jgi:Tfp pilus assembly protein FimV